MTQLIIDTSDDLAMLRAGRNMLNELLGEVATAVLTVKSGLCTDEKPEAVTKTAPLDGGDTSRGKAGGPGSGTDARKDNFNVDFSPEFCGEATEPFYGTGNRAGQWKKKRGVSQDDYDAWYAAELALAPAGSSAGSSAGDDDQINTAGAFGGGGGSEPAGDPAPEDCGAFMGWVSAKQAAGLLTQEDIGNAYAQADVQVFDLFPPNHEDAVRPRIAALYQILVVKAGA